MRRSVTVVTACWLLAAVAITPHLVAGEKIDFVSDRDEPGNWDIYEMDVDTLAVRRLTTDPGIDNHPDRSPDGTKVVWSSTRLAGGGNPEGDFEIFIATDDGGPAGLENATLTQLTFDSDNPHLPADMRSIPDRHPHFNHDPDDLKVLYTAKYYCVAVVKVRYVSVCSITRAIWTIDPCGRVCEAMRVIDVDTMIVTDIDHDMLTAANSAVWPTRPSTDARWIGHPSFSHDDSQILFSGAVDGEGRNWEVYVVDWNGTTVTSLRQVTSGSTYLPNPNPIQMSAGAHFSADDSTIIFTSTRTEFGNSQLFEVAASADKVPVDPSIRHAASSDKANDYVPEPLPDGRIVVTSDREDYQSVEACCGPPDEYMAWIDPSLPHTIRVEASGEQAPGSGGFRIHLDAYSLDAGDPVEEDVATTYSGSWSAHTSPNATLGYYKVTDGTSGEYVDIAVGPGTSIVTLYLGRTPSSGVARIYVDGTPITDGNYELSGDPAGEPSGWNLYTPDLVTSNDLDLIIISADGSTQTNFTDNDFADELLLIGDEVSWFCGLSPNVSLCTYLPKYFTIRQLRWMMERDGFELPEYYPSRCLYPIAYQTLDQYMWSGGNSLRPHNSYYWEQILWMMDFGGGEFDDELVVLPTPVNFCIENNPPDPPENPLAELGVCDLHLSTDPVGDPDGDPLTYDVYAGQQGEALLIVASDMPAPEAALCQVEPGVYEWRVVAKDCRGGLTYGPIWDVDTNALEPTNSWQEGFDSYWNGSGLHGVGCWKGWDDDPDWNAFVTDVEAHSDPHSVDIVGDADLVHEFCGASSGQWTFTAWQHVPSDFQSGCDASDNCGSYFILLNTYNDGGPYHWSVQLHADSITNTFIRDGVDPTSLPLITGQWVEIRVEIDLDNDLYRVFYDGSELGVAESWTAGVSGGGGGALNIGAVDLFANGSTSVYYDDLLLAAAAAAPCERGDLNCDGAINGFDIDPFVLALVDETGYYAAYPDCDHMCADIDCDGMVTGFDIDGFVDCVTAGVCDPCP